MNQSDLAPNLTMPQLRRAAIPIQLHELVDEVFDLGAEHVAIAEQSLADPKVMGVGCPNLVSIRLTHHRLAQLLAIGTDEIIAARLCNYSINRVSILKSDPAFADLMAFYAKNVVEEWRDFVAVAADLSMDVLQEIQKRLDESPREFTVNQLNDLMKSLSDRSGNAPIQRTQNTNINVNLGDRLRAARERANQELIEGVVLPPSHG